MAHECLGFSRVIVQQRIALSDQGRKHSHSAWHHYVLTYIQKHPDLLVPCSCLVCYSGPWPLGNGPSISLSYTRFPSRRIAAEPRPSPRSHPFHPSHPSRPSRPEDGPPTAAGHLASGPPSDPPASEHPENGPPTAPPASGHPETDPPIARHSGACPPAAPPASGAVPPTAPPALEPPEAAPPIAPATSGPGQLLPWVTLQPGLQHAGLARP